MPGILHLIKLFLDILLPCNAVIIHAGGLGREGLCLVCQ